MNRAAWVFIFLILLAGSATAGYVTFVGQNDNPSAPVGGLNIAGNWVGDILPSGSSTGLVMTTENVWFGVGGWYDLAVRQTSGFVNGAGGDAALRGGTSGSGITTIYEIDDDRTEYSTYTNAFFGKLGMWSHYGNSMVMNLLSGTVVVTNNLSLNASVGILNMKDGILSAAKTALSAGRVNMLADGSGDISLGQITTSFLVEMNFETENNGSITIDKTSSGTDFGYSNWKFAVSMGQLMVDGSSVTTNNWLDYFELSDDNKTISLIPEPEIIPPVLSLNSTAQPAAVLVNWTGQENINYELKQSPDVFFTNCVQSQYVLGYGSALSVECPAEDQRGFWKARAFRTTWGISVAQSGEYAGKLVRYDNSGTPELLRAIGVNYYDAFLRCIKDGNDTTFCQGFEYLRTHHVPVVRVLAAGFWPDDWNLYFSDKEEYFRRLDFFVEQAESHNVGLILDLFWRIATLGEIIDDAVAAGFLIPGVDFIPSDPLNIDINGDPSYAEYKRAMGRSDSGSNAFIAYFTQEVVNRYASSSAVWGWEFGNEYNLGVDHPNIDAMRLCRIPSRGDILPNTSTNLSLLPAWTGPDDLVRADVQIAKIKFAQTVRSIDTWRLIMSGDSIPRTSAYHNWQSHEWTKDSRAQLAEVLTVDNPSLMDTVTVHIYPGLVGESPNIYFSDDPVTNQWLTGQYQELFEYFIEQSTAVGRTLIVGEWGAVGDGTTDDEKITFNRMMQALINSRVQLALLWDFDTRNLNGENEWWIHTGQVEGWPATPKLYMITNDDPDLWDVEQANLYLESLFY